MRRREGRIRSRTQNKKDWGKKGKKWLASTFATGFDYLVGAQQRRARRQRRQKQDGGCLQRTSTALSGNKRDRKAPGGTCLGQFQSFFFFFFFFAMTRGVGCRLKPEGSGAEGRSGKREGEENNGMAAVLRR